MLRVQPSKLKWIRKIPWENWKPALTHTELLPNKANKHMALIWPTILVVLILAHVFIHFVGKELSMGKSRLPVFPGDFTSPFELAGLDP